jgi:O-antigen/teichoic acid export membrane protein
MRELAFAVLQTGGASLIALGLAVVATKIFAVVLGPAGIGFISLVRQTYQAALILGTLNGQTAIAQGIGSREEATQAGYLSTVFWILLLGGGTVALAFLLFPSQISVSVMGRDDWDSAQVIRWLSLAVLAGVASVYLSGVLSGHRAIGRLALLQIFGAAVAAVLAYPVALLLRAGHTPALALQIVLPAVAVSMLGLAFVMRGGWIPTPVRHAGLHFEARAARGFLRLAAAMLLSGVLATAIPLAVRAIAVRRFGLPGVGLFDVAWTISMNYVLLAIASFSAYYVPSLSRLSEPRDRQELIRRMLRLSIVLMVPLVVATTVLKPAIVRMLYSSAFLPAIDIMRWMLIGDYFRVTSWVFALTMIAYADVKTLVWTEMAWGGLSIGGAAFALLSLNSLEGVGANVVFVYATYLIFILSYVKSRRNFVLDFPIARTWLIGLGLILAASAQTWTSIEVHPALAVAYIGVAAGFSWTILTTEEKRGMRNGLRRAFLRYGLTVPEPF